jgi:hypothetical protein
MISGISTAQGQGLAISALSTADLDGPQALEAEAGWNQEPADSELISELVFPLK